MSHLTAMFPPLVAAEAGGGPLGGMLPLFLAMIAIVYFVVIRPESKREKDRRKRLDTLKKGDQVVIGGGILGRISNFDDPKVAVVEIADRVKVRVLKKDIVDTQESAMKDDDKAAAKAKDAKAKDADTKAEKAKAADAKAEKAKDDGDRKSA